MPVGSYCRRSVCTAHPEEGVRGAAQRMEKEGVGLLLVVEEGRPVGVLTDRDVALEVAAARRDPSEVRVADAMTRDPVLIAASAPLPQAASLMARTGVRRLPVVDEAGSALGVFAADDLVRLLADEIGGLADVSREQLPVGVDVGGIVSETEGIARPVDHYRRDVVQLRSDADIATVAEAMKLHGVGCVVVMGDAEQPVGIATDRDVALRAVAAGLDVGATPVSAIMSSPVVTADASQPLEEVVERMRTRGVRRIPILGDEGLVGLVTFDDLLVVFGRELQQLGEAALRDVRSEQLHARVERLRNEAEETLRELSSRLRELGEKTFERLRPELEALREKLRRSRD